MELTRIYLCALSDPIRDQRKYELWKPVFEQAGIAVELSRLLRQEVSARVKADDFNKALRSGRYSWIIDVSGGDLANTVLPYLDYEAYALSSTWYAAFSDGSCIVNALAACSHRRALLFPLWNQTSPEALIQIIRSAISPIDIEPLGDAGLWPRHARVYGGNIRCFLKLAGTGRMPDPSGSMMILESSGATWYSFCSMAAHLQQTGILDRVQGFVLGRFNVLERELGSRKIALEKIIQRLDSLCARTPAFYDAAALGHIPDSQGIWISAGHPYEELQLADFDLQKEADIIVPAVQAAVKAERQPETGHSAITASSTAAKAGPAAEESRPKGGAFVHTSSALPAAGQQAPAEHETEILSAASFLKIRDPQAADSELQDTVEFESVFAGQSHPFEK